MNRREHEWQSKVALTNPPLRLLIPIPYTRPGGFERVFLSLIRALSKNCETLVLIANKKNEIYLRSLLFPCKNIKYVNLGIVKGNYQCRIGLDLVSRLEHVLEKLNLRVLSSYLRRVRRNYQVQQILQQAVRDHDLTHCLYFLANQVKPPKLPIPIAVIVHDLFWSFSSLTYEKKYVENYNLSLRRWLQASKRVFSISQSTHQDLMTLFPECIDKIRVVHHSGFPGDDRLPCIKVAQSDITNFYYPSSFGIYKDQLSLLRAGVHLAENDQRFTLTFTGIDTEHLVNGCFSLSQQSSTREFDGYIRQCKELYRRYPHIFAEKFFGFGYCSSDEVEYYFQRCSCVVTTSRYEGFGLVLAEAIVRGIPVICSDLPVFREQVLLYKCEDRVRFFPVSDIGALVRCMTEFMDHPIRRLSNNEATQRFGHWRWENVAERYQLFLRSLN